MDVLITRQVFNGKELKLGTPLKITFPVATELLTRANISVEVPAGVHYTHLMNIDTGWTEISFLYVDPVDTNYVSLKLNVAHLEAFGVVVEVLERAVV